LGRSYGGRTHTHTHTHIHTHISLFYSQGRDGSAGAAGTAGPGGGGGGPSEGNWVSVEFTGVKDRLGSIERRAEVRASHNYV